MYCEKCGAVLTESKRFHEYDRDTGEKRYWTDYKCPTHGDEWYIPSMAFGGPCFIATAAFGSELDPRLDILRAFRDQVLIPNPLGKTFVNFYYKVSPPIADFIRDKEWLRATVRFILDPIVNALQDKYEQ
jgi:hypothetical protein